jgi:hypothetical protein
MYFLFALVAANNVLLLQLLGMEADFPALLKFFAYGK